MNCPQLIGDLPLVKVQYTKQEFQLSLFIASYIRKGVRVHSPSLGYFAATQFKKNTILGLCTVNSLSYFYCYTNRAAH